MLKLRDCIMVTHLRVLLLSLLPGKQLRDAHGGSNISSLIIVLVLWRWCGYISPAVIEVERKKQADAESIIKSLKESIEGFQNK